MKKKDLIILILIVVAMSSRFLFIVDGQSILPNFTAVGAIAILGAVHLNGMKKWIVPLVVLWISDLILNNLIYAEYYTQFQVFGSFWVYGSFILVGLVAYRIMRKASWAKLALTSVIGAVIFFLITNFVVWLQPTSPYLKDISGLMQSYIAGVPFFRNALLGNLFFGFALFGAYEFIASRMSSIDSIMSPKKLAEPV